MKLYGRIFKSTLQFLFYKWLLTIINLIRAFFIKCRRRKGRKEEPHRIRHNVTENCVPIRAVNYKRADPMIYSQYYLMKLGMGVTWDNPDIQLFLGNNPVSSHDLKPSTTYRLRARIWNASLEAPVVGMPVKFSYLDFGAGTISVPIGDSSADVGVLGGANNPSYTEVNWTTPGHAGHYCIQVRLFWDDDINPENNLGQENTNVVNPSSPAKFDFMVRNDGLRPDKFHIEVDTYQIPDRIDCREKEKLKKKGNRAFFIARNRRENYPVPAGWTVNLFQNDFPLNPGESLKVEGEIIPPDDFVGKKAFNFNVFTLVSKKFVGGVTIYVEKK